MFVQYQCLALYPWRCSCLSFEAFCPIFVLSGSAIASLGLSWRLFVPTQSLNRIGPSRQLVPLSGMAFLSNCALFHVICRACFIVCLRPSFFTGLGWECF